MKIKIKDINGKVVEEVSADKNLFGVDYNSSLDSDKIRSSTGLAIDWFTPIGPLSISFAAPITKADTDETETFRFRIGTTF